MGHHESAHARHVSPERQRHEVEHGGGAFSEIVGGAQRLDLCQLGIARGVALGVELIDIAFHVAYRLQVLLEHLLIAPAGLARDGSVTVLHLVEHTGGALTKAAVVKSLE